MSTTRLATDFDWRDPFALGTGFAAEEPGAWLDPIEEPAAELVGRELRRLVRQLHARGTVDAAALGELITTLAHRVDRQAQPAGRLRAAA
jgi:hypothetical protein